MIDWPYAEDGVKRGDFTEQFRYPIVNTSHPRWLYITAVVVSDGSDYRPVSIRPTDEELRLIGSFHRHYIEHWYRDSWKRRMTEKPFDLDGQANGRYLVKRAEGDWGYRKMTWTHGPQFVPALGSLESLDLVALMDRIHDWGGGKVSPSWAAWKTEHADEFPAVTS